MKRVQEIKKAREERIYTKRMDDHKHIKRRNLEIELAKHADLIEDQTIKQYILKKKTEREGIKLLRI